MRKKLETQLATKLSTELTKKLLDQYIALKERFFSGFYNPQNFEPTELKCGKFVEATLRVLQLLTSGRYTPLGRSIRFDNDLLRQFENARGTNDSIRIHIPRVLKAVYGIRNRRGVSHLEGEVNPNFIDATFVVKSCDWVMAELVRLFYASDINEAQTIINDLASKQVPFVWNYEETLYALMPKTDPVGKILVLLHCKLKIGLSVDELESGTKIKKKQLGGHIAQLLKKDLVIKSKKTGNFVLTPLGEAETENKLKGHQPF